MELPDETLDLIIYTIKNEIERYNLSQGKIAPLFYIEISVAVDLLNALVELKERRWKEIVDLIKATAEEIS